MSRSRTWSAMPLHGRQRARMLTLLLPFMADRYTDPSPMTTHFPSPFARAYPGQLFPAVFKTQPADFRVTEILPFEPDQDGSHWLLLIEKNELNTLDLLAEVARTLNIPRRSIGYSGLKDRFAVTRQWLTVPAQTLSKERFAKVGGARWHVLEWYRHRRKLRVGSHRQNGFEVMLRQLGSDPSQRRQMDERLEQIAQRGVPNYFGPQRFGKNGNNLIKVLQLFVKKQKISRQQHRFSVSAARSFLFNVCLSQRVKQSNWDAFLPGDLVILDGSNSWFELARLGNDGLKRLAAHDIHPSGPLWGRGAPATSDMAAAVERSCGHAFSELAGGLSDLGLKQERRALRLSVRALNWQWSADGLYLRFALARGGFATAMLGELVHDPQLAYPVPAALRDGMDQLASNT